MSAAAFADVSLSARSQCVLDAGAETACGPIPSTTFDVRYGADDATGMLDNMGCCGCAGVLGCVALRNLARMVPNPEASESAPPDAGCGPLICADVAGARLNRDRERKGVDRLPTGLLEDRAGERRPGVARRALRSGPGGNGRRIFGRGAEDGRASHPDQTGRCLPAC